MHFEVALLDYFYTSKIPIALLNWNEILLKTVLIYQLKMIGNLLFLNLLL